MFWFHNFTEVKLQKYYQLKKVQNVSKVRVLNMQKGSFCFLSLTNTCQSIFMLHIVNVEPIWDTLYTE